MDPKVAEKTEIEKYFSRIREKLVTYWQVIEEANSGQLRSAAPRSVRRRTARR